MKTERSKALTIVAALMALYGGAASAGPLSLSEQPIGLLPGLESRVPFDIRAIKAAENCDYSDDSFGAVWLNERPANSFDPAIGCHLQSNLGAMLGNHNDLNAGRGTRYSDGERAANVVSQYRKGEPKQDKTTPAKTNATATAPKTTGE